MMITEPLAILTSAAAELLTKPGATQALVAAIDLDREEHGEPTGGTAALAEVYMRATPGGLRAGPVSHSEMLRAIEETIERRPPVMGAALVLDADAVFADARRRVSVVFKLTVAISTVLAFLLLGGIAGAIIGALAGQAVWTVVFGAASAADVLGVIIYKPLTQLNNAIVSAQRLDLLFLSTRERLRDCRGHSQVEQQIACATRVWREMHSGLAALRGLA
jgi:hypothetical protein